MKKLRVIASVWSVPDSGGDVRFVRVTDDEAATIQEVIDFVEANVGNEGDEYGETVPRMVISPPIDTTDSALGDSDFGATMQYLGDLVRYSTGDGVYEDDCAEFEEAGVERS